MIQDHSVPEELSRVLMGAEELEGSSSTRHIFESLFIQYDPNNLRKEMSHYATILKTSGYSVDQRFSI